LSLKNTAFCQADFLSALLTPSWQVKPGGLTVQVMFQQTFTRKSQTSVKDSASLTVTTEKRILCDLKIKRILTGQFFNNLKQTNEPTLKPDPNVFKIFAHPQF